MAGRRHPMTPKNQILGEFGQIGQSRCPLYSPPSDAGPKALPEPRMSKMIWGLKG